jgi:hypothetical protein
MQIGRRKEMVKNLTLSLPVPTIAGHCRAGRSPRGADSPALHRCHAGIQAAAWHHVTGMRARGQGTVAGPLDGGAFTPR